MAEDINSIKGQNGFIEHKMNPDRVPSPKVDVNEILQGRDEHAIKHIEIEEGETIALTKKNNDE